MICELTCMMVANCSMYDWATALGEAARMAARVKGRNEILVPDIIHPERASTLKVYTDPAGIKVKKVRPPRRNRTAEPERFEGQDFRKDSSGLR